VHHSSAACGIGLQHQSEEGTFQIGNSAMVDVLVTSDLQTTRMDARMTGLRLMVEHYQGCSCHIDDIEIVLVYVEQQEDNEPQDDGQNRIDCRKGPRLETSPAFRRQLCCENIVKSAQTDRREQSCLGLYLGHIDERL